MGLDKDIGRDHLRGEIDTRAVLGFVRSERRCLEVGAGAVGAGLRQARVLVPAHVIPRPAVEAAFLDRGDVVGDQVVAEVIALVGGAPELSGDWVDGLADAVADAVGIDLDELAFGGVLEHVGAVELLGVGVRVIHVGAGAHRDEHVLTVLGEDDVAGPVAAAGELGVAGDVGNDGLGRAGGVQIAGVIRNALYRCGIADVDVLRVVSRIEGDAEGMVEAGGELLDLSGFAVGAYAAKDKDGAGAGVSEKEIAVGCGADEARHGEGAAAQLHVFLIVGTLHGDGVAAGVERDFEAVGSDGPRVGRARDDMRCVVHRLVRLGRGKVGESDLAENARLLLIPIGERVRAGNHLLRR